MGDGTRDLIPVADGRVFFLCTDKVCVDDAENHYFTIDDQFIYYPVNKDNGPLSVNYVYRFCTLLGAKLKNVEFRRKRIVVFTSASGPKRSCAAVLVGAYLVLCWSQSPQDVVRRFMNITPTFMPFTDSSEVPSRYELSIYDCIYAISRAVQRELFTLESFNLREYEYYDMAENGDMNWIIPNHILAFSSPTDVPTKEHPFTPENYIGYFKKHGISLVVRLCSSHYDKTGFTSHGIDVVDLAFPDGGTPEDAILIRFIKLMRQRKRGESSDGSEDGIVNGITGSDNMFLRSQKGLSALQSTKCTPGVAVHCKAGLGRTGTLIACYLMSDYGFAPKEVIGYVRMVRPGSIVGDQQKYLENLYIRLDKGFLNGV